MRGVEICLLGCYGLMMEVFGLDLTVIVMMERPLRTLKVRMVRNNFYSYGLKKTSCSEKNYEPKPY
jgi:hypothetical protein